MNHAIAAVFASSLLTSERLLLLALLTHPSGRPPLSVAQLGACVGCSPRNARVLLASLRAKGWLRSEPTRNECGGTGPNTYAVTVPELPAGRPDVLGCVADPTDAS